MRAWIGRIPVDILENETHAIHSIKALLQNVEGMKKPSFVVTLNPEIAYRACTDRTVRYIVTKSKLNLIDGIGIAKIIQWKTGRKPNRITGVDTIWRLLMTLTSDVPVYLFGARKNVLDIVVSKLTSQNHHLNIIGFSHGYLPWDDVAKDIEEKKPKLLLVALGAGRQERFMYHYIRHLDIPLIAVGVGGSFDVWAEKVERAPQWVQTMGFEWLWRNIKEPKRIGRLLYSLTYMLIAMKKEVHIYEE